MSSAQIAFIASLMVSACQTRFYAHSTLYRADTWWVLCGASWEEVGVPLSGTAPSTLSPPEPPRAASLSQNQGSLESSLNDRRMPSPPALCCSAPSQGPKTRAGAGGQGPGAKGLEEDGGKWVHVPGLEGLPGLRSH